MSDMTALLNDLSYIPPNNEHNEPTQGDIGETSNKPTQAKHNEFEELYASANEEFDIDVYLRPLIEDLKVLWDRKGVETIDVASGQKFNMRAMFELIYPPAFFDIMVYLVIHLPIEALEGGPIHPRWMYQFERYMKKLKGYVRNKAKPEGSIAEGYVAEEALTFSFHYFWDVTTKFIDPDLKKVKWYVLHNSPEIDTYRSQFKSLFPNKDMQEEFPDWFGSQIRQRHVDNDQDLEVSTTSELFALANGPSWTPISINSCVVDGVRYVVHSRDERRTTQNSGICSPGPDGEMYYGQLQEIIEFKYLLFKVALFRVKWFDTSNKGQDDPDIIHFDNSSDLPLSTSLNDLNNATLHIDGQSTVVDAPPDIIDVPDEDDDIIGDEDALPHDLADSDAEDLINVDDDGVEKMSADVARSHGGDGGGDDRPPSHVVPTGCGGCFANKGNGDKQTLNPLGPHAAHWSNYIGEVVRSVPLYYPSWEKVPKERKAAIISEIGTLFDPRPHMDSSRWIQIYEGISMHLQKAYNTNKASFKAKHWKADPTTGVYDVEAIRRARPVDITAAEWDKYIKFWNDPKNLARAAQNRLNRQKSVVISRQGSRSLARLQDEMRQASDTQEEERKRLEATGEYTNDEINALAIGGKLRGHIPGVVRVLPFAAPHKGKCGLPSTRVMFKKFESGGAIGVAVWLMTRRVAMMDATGER
ncbi:putative reverse transcriptase domain, ribonuclease H-like domain, aspartic peptidase domain protein [Tanacetum coccineum]